MITLYNARMSRSTRVLWLLEELGADYEVMPVTITRPDGSGGPDPANPHPLKQVPAIEHDGALIVESLAIWLYLSDLFPASGMAPGVGDPRRADYVGWMGLSTAAFEPLFAAARNGALDDRQEAARLFIDRKFANALEHGPYLLGAAFSTVDLVYASLLRFNPALMTESDAYRDWLARIGARPALSRAREKDARC
jgi:glutathione S-transferase